MVLRALMLVMMGAAGPSPLARAENERPSTVERGAAFHHEAGGNGQSEDDAEKRQNSAKRGQSRSATGISVPLIRAASAALMKGSSAPSKTSDGVGLTMPVRKSLTIW